MLFTCSDGEVLSLDDTGDPGGTPVVYLHGTPDSRLSRHPDDSLAAAAGVRLLAVDRPGYGDSSPARPGEPVSETHDRFTVHLAELLAHLGADGATLLAWSGGALAALTAASASALAGTLRELVIVAGVVPREAHDDPRVREAAPDRAGLFELADAMSPGELAETVAPMVAPHPCDRDLAWEHQREQRGPAEQAALAGVPGAVEQMADSLVEAVRGGLQGVATDVLAQNGRDTVPDPARVELPVRLWYGGHDRTTPAALGVWYQGRIPGAHLEVVEGAGHMLPVTHWPRLLRALTPT